MPIIKIKSAPVEPLTISINGDVSVFRIGVEEAVTEDQLSAIRATSASIEVIDEEGGPEGGVLSGSSSDVDTVNRARAEAAMDPTARAAREEAAKEEERKANEAKRAAQDADMPGVNPPFHAQVTDENGAEIDYPVLGADGKEVGADDDEAEPGTLDGNVADVLASAADLSDDAIKDLIKTEKKGKTRKSLISGLQKILDDRKEQSA